MPMPSILNEVGAWTLRFSSDGPIGLNYSKSPTAHHSVDCGKVHLSAAATTPPPTMVCSTKVYDMVRPKCFQRVFAF